VSWTVQLAPPSVFFARFSLRPLTFGTTHPVYVNRSPAVVALWPPGLVTVTSTGPTLPGGATARIALLEAGAKLAARFGPKATAVAPESSCPAIVTVVPPVAGPEAGLST